MRTSSLMTVSLPPQMATEAKKIAKRKQMTSSELMRTALRFYFEQEYVDRVVRAAATDFRFGKAKVLPPGGLADLMKS